MRRVLTFVVAGAALALPQLAAAGPNRQACVAAYEEAQTQMRRSRLHEARASLTVCLEESCPGALRADCAGWLREVEARTPTVVVEVTQDGTSMKDATLLVDGKPATVDGRSMELDPGSHVFKVDARTGTVSQDVMLREGEKLRVVRLELPPTRKAEAPRVAAAPVPRAVQVHARPIPWTVWAAGGVGVVSLGLFGTFAAIGTSKESDLDACKPTCAQDRIDDVHAKYVLADVFLGVGVVALGAATVLYFTRPTITAEKSALFKLATGQPVPF